MEISELNEYITLTEDGHEIRLIIPDEMMTASTTTHVPEGAEVSEEAMAVGSLQQANEPGAEVRRYFVSVDILFHSF